MSSSTMLLSSFRAAIRSPMVASASASASRRTMMAAATATASTADEPLLMKTSLNEWHKELGGEMVPFAGYELPVLYKGDNVKNGGVMKEHLWCRSEGKASLFDVSHMGQIRWHGKDRVKFVEKMVVGDIQGLDTNHGCLSLITNDHGGIMDDTVIVNAGDYIHMVVNGSMKFSDMAHFQKHLNDYNGDVTMEYLEDDMQLLALQGSGSANVISKLLPDGFNLNNMAFMTGVDTTIDGIKNCRITRCGYTGEDGFEISIPSGISTIQIASKLCNDYPEIVNPTGLGARDSLRLEAGLCLYGNDLNENINPIMGTLAWTLGKGGPKARRRQEQDFIGATSFLKEDGKLKKQERKRIGIIGMKAPARQYTEIYDVDGINVIGEITSGTYSPCLKKPIAMGYIDTVMSKNDTPIKLKIRNKMVDAQVTKMPFVESNYYRVPE